MTEIHWTEVDGVTTVWAESTGPLRAGLLFRTGRVDETLAKSGFTHLIEHLAFSTISENTQNSNGFVSDLFTGFYTTGLPDNVATFFQSICEALTRLPEGRLEAEKQILAAENSTRPYNLQGTLLKWRYGAVGHGLSGFNELGLRGATLAQLIEFGEKRFTRENVILWVNGSLPKGFRLGLPSGIKQPLPSLSPVLPTFPSYFYDEHCRGIAVGATVPRISESSIFCTLAQKRLHDHLRIKQAVSYAPLVFYDHLDTETAHLVLFAGSEENRRAELVKAFAEVIQGFAEIDESDVENARKQYLEHITGPLAPQDNDRIALEIQRTAWDWLMGRKYETIESLAAGTLSVKAADVSAYWSEMQKTLLIALPNDASIEPWMGKSAPLTTEHIVVGREILNKDWPVDRIRLVHSPDGVSLKWPDGSQITVRYQNLAAAFRYADGCIYLCGNDGSWIAIEPTLWRNGPSICREISQRIPPELLLDYGPRTDDEIPKPRTTGWQRFIASIS